MLAYIHSHPEITELTKKLFSYSNGNNGASPSLYSQGPRSPNAL